MEEKNKKEAHKMSEEEKVVVEEEEEEMLEEEEQEGMEELLPAPDAPIITMKKLLEAGVHFGHQTRRWNPKMKPYIYTARNGIYIVDLEKTVEKITEAYQALKKIVSDGGKVIFVGTKKQSQDIIKEEALRSGSFYVTTRWLGGTLTNFKTIQKRIKYLKDIEIMENDGTFNVLPKKEVAQTLKMKEKLEKTLGGIKEMRRLPQAVFVVDPRIELNAVNEARKLRIPVFGIVDTNSDPDLVDYIIPANDDASKSIKLIVSVLADAVVEAKGGQTLVAYTKDEGEEATMTDVIANADRAEEAKQQARRAASIARRQQQQARRFGASRRTTPVRKTEIRQDEPSETEVEESSEVEVKSVEKTTEKAKKPRAPRKPKAEVSAEKVEEPVEKEIKAEKAEKTEKTEKVVKKVKKAEKPAEEVKVEEKVEKGLEKEVKEEVKEEE